MEIASPDGQAMEQIIQINDVASVLNAILSLIQKSSGFLTGTELFLFINFLYKNMNCIC